VFKTVRVYLANQQKLENEFWKTLQFLLIWVYKFPFLYFKERLVIFFNERHTEARMFCCPGPKVTLRCQGLNWPDAMITVVIVSALKWGCHGWKRHLPCKQFYNPRLQKNPQCSHCKLQRPWTQFYICGGSLIKTLDHTLTTDESELYKIIINISSLGAAKPLPIFALILGAYNSFLILW